MRFISIGGWCGNVISLRYNNLYNEAFPFDHIRSTFNGIINCIETNFSNFFPENIKLDNFPFYNWHSFRGKYFGFYHHDLTQKKVIEDFNRRIQRFNSLLENTNEDLVFLRTISTHNFNDELDIYQDFIKLIENKYPKLNFILIFIIPGQDNTQYYKNLDSKTFIFTLDDNSEINDNLGIEYKPIYDFILKNNLFTSIPHEKNIKLKNNYNRFVSVSGINFFKESN